MQQLAPPLLSSCNHVVASNSKNGGLVRMDLIKFKVRIPHASPFTIIRKEEKRYFRAVTVPLPLQEDGE